MRVNSWSIAFEFNEEFEPGLMFSVLETSLDVAHSGGSLKFRRQKVGGGWNLTVLDQPPLRAVGQGQVARGRNCVLTMSR